MKFPEKLYTVPDTWGNETRRYDWDYVDETIKGLRNVDLDASRDDVEEFWELEDSYGDYAIYNNGDGYKIIVTHDIADTYNVIKYEPCQYADEIWEEEYKGKENS